MSYPDYLGGREGVSQIPKTETDRLAAGRPYEATSDPYRAAGAGQTRSRTDPRGWKLRTKILVAVAVVVVIIAVIVGAYEGVRANRYPNYSALNYTLTDTYQGTNFFDNFQYWSAADPTAGFVV
jgi:hypothetical protein